MSYCIDLYHRTLAINPNIEHKVKMILITQSSINLLPNNGCSMVSPTDHTNCPKKKKRKESKNKKATFFIRQT